MVYTIKVKKKRKGEEFSFTGLVMFHGECYGGSIDTEIMRPDLVCIRCGASLSIDQEDRIKLIKTAIDGKERKLKENGIAVQEPD